MRNIFPAIVITLAVASGVFAQTTTPDYSELDRLIDELDAEKKAWNTFFVSGIEAFQSNASRMSRQTIKHGCGSALSIHLTARYFVSLNMSFFAVRLRCGHYRCGLL